MKPPNKPTVPPIYLKILNQLYDMELKVKNSKDCETTINHINRNIERMKNIFLGLPEIDGSPSSFEYHNPMKQPYDDTRNDIDIAHIIGDKKENLRVVEVMKPIIKAVYQSTGRSIIVQNGVVIVESDNTSNGTGESNEKNN